MAHPLRIMVIVMVIVGSAWGRGVADAVAETKGSEEIKRIFDLNKEIAWKEDRLEQLQKEIERHRESIIQAQGRAKSLERLIAVLDDRIAKKRLEIEHVITEREEVELEITATKLETDVARQRMARRQQLLRALLTDLRRVDGQPTVQIVLANASVSEYFRYRNQLAQLQGNVGRLLRDVRNERELLEATEERLAERKEELRALTERLEVEQSDLADEQDARERLLTTTRSSERRYQDILAANRAEAAAIDAEIVSLEARVREQLAAIDEQFGRDGRVAFSWPVPNRGITAGFHDPEYPYRHIFEHNAVDIRASQGLDIRAPAPGYVAKTKDNGYGYSYIVIVHPGGFSTVYGHVSCSKVQEGTYIERGDSLGCVGGRPGTRGAGPWTSGSHLHFEIRLNGIPVNPLNYLL